MYFITKRRTLQNYIKDRLKSRDKEIGDKLICEFVGCNKDVSDIHHILCSFRGSRKSASDGSDLIGLCRTHHTWVHNHNNYDNRLLLLDRVAGIMQNIRLNQ